MMQDLKKSKLGYGSIYAADFITNRLVGDSLGTYDPFLRIIKIVRDDGEKHQFFLIQLTQHVLGTDKEI